MLGRLNLNKFVSFLLLLLFSCAESKYKQHTEVSCPGTGPVLLRYTTIEDIKASIAKNIEDNRKFNTAMSYTVIYIPGGSSVQFGVPPEKMSECKMISIPVAKPDKNIVKYY